MIVTNFSTTSPQAGYLQNIVVSLALVVKALDPQCDKYLTTEKRGSFTHDILSFVASNSQGDLDKLIGVGSFPNTPLVNATVALPNGGSAFLVVNANGAFFNAHASVGYGPANNLTGGTLEAQAEIVLHEMAHEYGSVGFADDNLPNADNSAAQANNNSLIFQNCANTLNWFGAR